jgi:hypothetical protein
MDICEDAQWGGCVEAARDEAGGVEHGNVLPWCGAETNNDPPGAS